MPTINYWNGTKWVAVSSASGGGAPGPQGPKGDKGDAGRSVTVTVSQAEPVAPVAGDVWIDNSATR